jgi:chloramphenicol-sensitive protein RarD
LLEPANAVEILAQRMIWTLVVVAFLVWRLHLWNDLRATVRDRGKVSRLAVAAVAISVNWGLYIWAVNSEHVLDASLGYFITPLFTVLVGVVFLRERLRRLQWAAVGVASIAIIVLGVDNGRLPWIALTLALSFTLYSLLKKQAGAGAVESLTIETAVLALPALATLGYLAADDRLAFGHHGVGNAALLAGAGIVTAVPLLLFTGAARRLPLSQIGLIQDLTPVMQFLLAVLVYHEHMSASRWAGFALVWVALIVLVADGLRTQQLNRRGPEPEPLTAPHVVGEVQPVRSRTV